MTNGTTTSTAPAHAGAVPAPADHNRVFAAIDIGASSGRVMLGRVSAVSGVSLETIHRFPNGVVELDGGLRWDFDALFAEVLKGLAAAAAVAARNGEAHRQHRHRHLGCGLRTGERRRRPHLGSVQLPGRAQPGHGGAGPCGHFPGEAVRHHRLAVSCSSTRSTSSPQNRPWKGCRPS